MGATFQQLGSGGFANGTWTYQFLVLPHPPPEVYAESLAVRVYNATTDVAATLTGVVLEALNGTTIASYTASGGWWSSASSQQVENPAVLVVTDSVRLAGLWLACADSVSELTEYLVIQ